MITDFKKCTGCLACYNICPFDAISIRQDEKIRAESTSGGMFSELAKAVIRQSGTVYGAAFDENYKVVHKKTENIDGLKEFQKSKYVQGYIGYSYKKIKKELETGKGVLFSGTPCQVAGLRKYLGNNYDNLSTLDLICHGVPSPLLFNAYLDYLRKLHGVNEIRQVDFRSRQKSWTDYLMNIRFVNGYSYIRDRLRDPYIISFVKNYCLRDSCYSCKYASCKRQGDISLEDFWGYKSESRKLRNDEKGINLLMINTEKGMNLIDSVRKKCVITEKTISEAMQNNTLRYPSVKNKDGGKFWDEFMKSGRFEDCVRYLDFPQKVSFKAKVARTYYDKYYLMPSFIRKKIDIYIMQYLRKKRDGQKE